MKEEIFRKVVIFMELTNDEALNTYGGDGFSIFAGVSAAIAFIISIVDGFLNPKECGQ